MISEKIKKNNVAVSPVIGTLLILAITVILAAIYSSTAFNQETPHSAPKVSIEIKANTAATGNDPASIKLEHLGGDQICFGDSTITQVKASLNGGESVPINATCLGNMSVGDLKILSLASSGTSNAFGIGPLTGDIVNVKIIDIKNNQLISNQDVKF